jgi:hypothetical protein
MIEPLTPEQETTPDDDVGPPPPDFPDEQDKILLEMEC